MWLAAAAVAAAVLALTACTTTSNSTGNADEAAKYNTELGLAYMRRGNLALAKNKLELAEKENRHDPNVQGALALLYQRLGRPDLADQHFRTALRLAPNDPDISNNYAIYLCGSHREKEGVRRFLAAARNPLYRTPAAAYTNAGVCLRQIHQDQQARQDFQQALKLRPAYAEAAFQLANLDLDQGHAQAALKRISTFIGSHSATPDLLLLGVRAARAQGNAQSAEYYSQQLRVNFPESNQARTLSRLDHKSG